ncbi:MAG: alanine racemase [Clostridia bacterium]|nr:alanine racemase [Clostridia bacterium]
MISKYRTWCEVNLDTIYENFIKYRNFVGKDTKIMAVIKADAYGHGAIPCAEKLQGVTDYFAVAFADEAIDLRENNITAPILILGYSPKTTAKTIVENDITATVYDVDCAKELSKEAKKQGKTAKIHIKIDTGMSRIGFIWDSPETIKQITEISKLENIETEGIFTHFATADEEDCTFTNLQFRRFMSIVNTLEKSGVKFKIKHCCNSAGAMRFPDMHLDMVRIGIGLYGCYPSEFNYNLDLAPAMSMKTRVVNVKTVKKGDSVSYGATFTAKEDMKVATISVGYADGYLRTLSDKASVLVNGKYAKILGRICMDLCMIDVSDVNNISVGDEVLLFGTKDDGILPVSQLASISETISYEILCGMAKRVPRIYTHVIFAS